MTPIDAMILGVSEDAHLSVCPERNSPAVIFEEAQGQPDMLLESLDPEYKSCFFVVPQEGNLLSKTAK